MSYDAFISYNQAADGELAPKLQRGLERLSRAWYQRRPFLRVVRDATTFGASADLDHTITAALDAADHLVLLVSPGSAASPWTNREVEHWLATKPAGSITIVVTSWAADIGRPAGQLTPLREFDWHGPDVPPALHAAIVEPIAVDLRGIEDPSALTLDDPEWEDSVALIAAAIKGQDKDELVGELVQMRTRARILTGSLLLGLLILLLSAAVAGAQWWWADQRADDARAAEAAANDATVAAEQRQAEAEAAASAAEGARAEAEAAAEDAERAKADAESAAADALVAEEVARAAEADARRLEELARSAQADAESDRDAAQLATVAAEQAAADAEQAEADAVTAQQEAERLQAEAETAAQAARDAADVAQQLAADAVDAAELADLSALSSALSAAALDFQESDIGLARALALQGYGAGAASVAAPAGLSASAVDDGSQFGSRPGAVAALLRTLLGDVNAPYPDLVVVSADAEDRVDELEWDGDDIVATRRDGVRERLDTLTGELAILEPVDPNGRNLGPFCDAPFIDPVGDVSVRGVNRATRDSHDLGVTRGGGDERVAPGLGDCITAMAISADGGRLAVASNIFRPGEVRSTDFGPYRLSVWDISGAPALGTATDVSGYDRYEMSPDGQTFLIADGGSYRHGPLDALSSPWCPTPLDAGDCGSAPLAIDNRSQTAVIHGGGCDVHVVDLTSTPISVRTTLTDRFEGAFGAICVGPDGVWALSESNGGRQYLAGGLRSRSLEVSIVEVATDTALPIITAGSSDWLQDLAWSPDGRAVAAVSDQGRIDVREILDSGDHVDLLIDVKEFTGAVAWVGDDRLGVGLSDGSIQLVPITRGDELAAEDGERVSLFPGERVRALDAGIQTRWIAAANLSTFDGLESVVFYDTVTGRVSGGEFGPALPAHPGMLRLVQSSGEIAIVAGGDDALHRWPLDIDIWLRAACRLRSTLTDDQQAQFLDGQADFASAACDRLFTSSPP